MRNRPPANKGAAGNRILQARRLSSTVGSHEQPMSHPPSIRPFAPHEWRTYREMRLHALADSPDAFARTLAEEEGRQNAEWSARLESGTTSRYDLPLVAEVGTEPVGLAWGRIDPAEPEVAYLYQVWVAPNRRCLGAGRMLLEAVIAWASAADARYLALDVTCGDSPATRLYTRTGFQPIGEPKPLRPGSTLLEQLMQLELRGRVVS